jgi:hypothetical protein
MKFVQTVADVERAATAIANEAIVLRDRCGRRSTMTLNAPTPP